MTRHNDQNNGPVDLMTGLVKAFEKLEHLNQHHHRQQQQQQQNEVHGDQVVIDSEALDTEIATLAKSVTEENLVEKFIRDGEIVKKLTDLKFENTIKTVLQRLAELEEDAVEEKEGIKFVKYLGELRLFKKFLLTAGPRILIQNHKSMATNIQATLDEHSTTKYFIEYNGFLSNHISHGIIALHRLNSPEDRLNRFIQWYNTKLESPSISDESVTEYIDKLIGKRTSYYSILKHYQNLFENYGKSLDDLIAAEFPKLSIGLAGSALHGMIHLGYCYSVKNERVVLEGLAYLHHSNAPVESSCKGSFGQGTSDILDILADIAKDDTLRQAMLDGFDKDRYKALKVGTFQRKVACLLSEEGDKLVSKVLSIKLPQEALQSDGTINVHQLAKIVLKWIITVYTVSEIKNDFFLLHGVTAAWSLLQIISLLKYTDAVNAIQHYLTVLLAVYISRDSAALTVPLKDRKVTSEDWDKLIDRTVKADRDEHCYKLVQVCYEMAKDDPGASPLYIQAAESSIENEFII